MNWILGGLLEILWKAHNMKSLAKYFLVACVGVASAGVIARADTLDVQYYTIGTFSYTTSAGPTSSPGPTNIFGDYYTQTAPNTKTYLNNSAFAGNGTSTFTVSALGGTTTLSFDSYTAGVLDPAVLNGSISGGFATDLLNPATLGSFTFNTTLSNHSPSELLDVENLTFILSIFQVVPTTAGGASGEFVGSVSTNVKLTLHGSDSGSAIIDFSANPTVFYSSPEPVFDPQNHPYQLPIRYSLDPVSVEADFGGGASPVTADLSTDGLGGGGNSVPLPAVASMGMTMLGLVVCGLAGRKLTRRVQVG